MTSEGGFQGRANKVVDACYSYWGGGLFPLIDRLLQMKTQSPNTNANITNNSNVEVHSPTQTDLIGDEEGAKKTKRNLRTSAISMKSLRDSMKSGMSITEISESGEALDEVTRMNSVEMRDWSPNESGVVSESMDEDEEIDEISIAENLINMKHRSESFDQRPAGWLFNQKMLQQYLLTCAQEKNGGLRDKPGKYVILNLYNIISPKISLEQFLFFQIPRLLPHLLRLKRHICCSTQCTRFTSVSSRQVL
jgi:protein farnesyltransferase subunit beta